MEIEIRGAPAHTRTLDVVLSQADPGRLAAHGIILDLRKRGLVPMAGDLQASGVIHHMRVDATLEVNGPTLETIRAEQQNVAFEPSAGTGGECCRDPVERIEALAGARLDASFAKRLGRAIGGPRGCSHVLTLTQLMGSCASAAVDLDRARHGPSPDRAEGERVFDRSLSVDGVESPEGDLCLALQLADLHFAPAPPGADALERLAGRREVRVDATVDLSTMTVARIRAAERETGAQTLDSAPWEPLDVAFLEGRSALVGMARSLFEELGGAPERRPLLDTLLNLAPGVIQCMPALTRYWQRWRDAQASGSAPDTSASSPMTGGMVDSCYMWRRDGALGRRMTKDLPKHVARARESGE